MSREILTGAVIFDNIEDMLNALGWNKPVSERHQKARDAWQREAEMTPMERKAAFEARVGARHEI